MTFSRSQEEVSKVSKYMFLLNYLLHQKEQAMKYSSSWYRSVLAGMALVAGIGMFATPVFAQTAPGTVIGNTATLNYAVGGVSQTPIAASSPTFVVDRKVLVTVTESNSLPTQVVPGSTKQVTTFSVSNTGNLAQAYTLTAAELPNGQTVSLGGTLTDNLALVAAPACAAFVENGLAAGYTPSGVNQDTAVAITSLNPGASATVYVVCDIPLTATNGQVAIVSLTATTAETACCTATGTGCTATVESPRGVADDPTTIQIVFADAAGSEAGDIVRDGKHSARDAYVISAAAITVSKTFSLQCDPVNFNVSPRSIPGAIVQYSVTVSNAVGAASATLQTIADTLNANLQFDNNLALASGAACPGAAESAVGRGFKLICTGGSRACVATPVFYTSVADADSMDITGQVINANLGTALIVEGAYAAGELKAGESVTVRFNAVIR